MAVAEPSPVSGGRDLAGGPHTRHGTGALWSETASRMATDFRVFGLSGFPRITRERICRSSRNLAYLTSKPFYIFPENFKPVPTMTFGLISKVMSSEICVPYRSSAWNLRTSVFLLAIWTWIGVAVWHPWFTLTLWPFRSQQRSSEVDDLWWGHASFLGFLCPQG